MIVYQLLTLPLQHHGEHDALRTLVVVGLHSVVSGYTTIGLLDSLCATTPAQPNAHFPLPPAIITLSENRPSLTLALKTPSRDK